MIEISTNLVLDLVKLLNTVLNIVRITQWPLIRISSGLLTQQFNSECELSTTPFTRPNFLCQISCVKCVFNVNLSKKTLAWSKRLRHETYYMIKEPSTREI